MEKLAKDFKKVGEGKPKIELPADRFTPEEKEKMSKSNKKRLEEIEAEFQKITEECDKMKGNWNNLEDIKGDYSDLTDQVKDVKRDVERLSRERKRVYSQIKNLKGKINDVHTRKNKEFGMTKDTYKYFWNELLMVSVKLSEIEDMFEKNERVTEMDLLELKTNVDSLEKKLGAVNWVASKRKAMERKSKKKK